MATAFDSIEAAVVALLAAGTPVSTRIETDEARPLGTQYTDGVLVRITHSDIEPAAISGGPLLAQTTMEIELRKLGPVAQSAAKALATLLAAVNGRIAAAPGLGGLAMDTRLISLDFETAPGEVPAHSCLMTWTVEHQISRTTLA